MTYSAEFGELLMRYNVECWFVIGIQALILIAVVIYYAISKNEYKKRLERRSKYLKSRKDRK